MPLLKLPNELLFQIIDNLGSTQDITSCCQVNRRLNPVAKKHLYRYDVLQCGSSALLWAAAKGREQTVMMWLDAVGSLGERAYSEVLASAILNAWRLVAQHGHVKVAQLLLDTGKVDIDSNDSGGLTPLSWAAENGHVEMVKLLLDTGKVDIEFVDTYYGWTPLSWAARAGHVKVVQLLLGTDKVDINRKDSYDRTPLLLAIENEHVEVAQLLLDTGKVDIDSNDSG
ncbi:putative ankyrin repeat-containing protein, partial [Periconia macrospinosa]